MDHKKLRCGILGATGSVGQKFIELLQDHPWFDLVFLSASERSANKLYKEACQWQMSCNLKKHFAEMVVHDSLKAPKEAYEDVPLIFSALDASCAEEIESFYATEGKIVVSNTKSFRMHPKVPLVVPEVNLDHLNLVREQDLWKGGIVCNPNCCVVGLTLALKPLDAIFGVKDVQVTSMQAISGAGFNGLGANSILDNVIPYIVGEEKKVESEPQKILGSFSDGELVSRPICIDASCNRVPVTDGHTLSISVNLKKQANKQEVLEAFDNYYGNLDLPSAPSRVLHYFHSPFLPQPKLHRGIDKSMSISIGRLEESKLFDYKFHVVSHNTIRGAAGGALLNAEVLYKQGYFETLLELSSTTIN